MIKKIKTYSLLFTALLLLSQLIFYFYSAEFTKTTYRNRVFFTTGIVFDGSDLHKLTEGAHYFGNTIVGWSRFPSFRADLIRQFELSQDIKINLHIQERQNLVFLIESNDPMSIDQLKGAKDYLQGKIEEYNSNTNTQFVMTNVDYEQLESSRSYAFGALVSLAIAVLLFLLIFFTKEIYLNLKLNTK